MSTKSSQILSFQLQVCLSKCNLLVDNIAPDNTWSFSKNELFQRYLQRILHFLCYVNGFLKLVLTFLCDCSLGFHCQAEQMSKICKYIAQTFVELHKLSLSWRYWDFSISKNNSRTNK